MNFEFEPLPEDSDTIIVELHSELSSVVSGFEVSAKAISADQNRTPVRRARDLDSLRRDVLTELDLISRTLSVDRQEFTRRKRELRRPQPATGDTGLRYQEVRATLRALTSAKRKSLLQDALASSDALLLWAVIEAPGYLTGMSTDEHTLYTKQAHDALHGVETRELEQAEKLANRLAQQIEKARAHIDDFGKEGLANAV